MSFINRTRERVSRSIEKAARNRKNSANRKENEIKYLNEKRFKIRMEEISRAENIREKRETDKIRSEERTRAERKAGVTSLLDSFTPNLDVNNSKPRRRSSPKSSGKSRTNKRGGRNNTTSNNRRVDFFNASGADETIFSGSSSSGTPKGKQKKVSKNKLDGFRIFDEL